MHSKLWIPAFPKGSDNSPYPVTCLRKTKTVTWVCDFKHQDMIFSSENPKVTFLSAEE